MPYKKSLDDINILIDSEQNNNPSDDLDKVIFKLIKFEAMILDDSFNCDIESLNVNQLYCLLDLPGISAEFRENILSKIKEILRLLEKICGIRSKLIQPLFIPASPTPKP